MLDTGLSGFMLLDTSFFQGGGLGFFMKELAALLIACIYAFGFSYFMLVVINWVTPVKVSEIEEYTGLDEATHSEIARDNVITEITCDSETGELILVKKAE